MSPLAELISVLEEAKRYLLFPDNNFIYSGWEDAGEAIAEIDAHIETLLENRLPKQSSLSILFVGTGPIQEVAVSSGWGQAFLDLASRFDLVVEKAFQNIE